METWLRRWPIVCYLSVPVGQIKGGCRGRLWVNHRGAPKCRLQRWLVHTSKPLRASILLWVAQGKQKACGCVWKAEDCGSWWSPEPRRIQQLHRALALYRSSMKDQVGRDPLQQDQVDAHVLPRRWEEDRGSTCSKMTCMPHICNNVVTYWLMRSFM